MIRLLVFEQMKKFEKRVLGPKKGLRPKIKILIERSVFWLFKRSYMPNFIIVWVETSKITRDTHTDKQTDRQCHLYIYRFGGHFNRDTRVTSLESNILYLFDFCWCQQGGVYKNPTEAEGGVRFVRYFADIICEQPLKRQSNNLK